MRQEEMITKGDSVLIIEDSHVQRAVMINLVKELGFTPHAVEEFDDSIPSLLSSSQIKVVLLDLMLLDEGGNPMLDGFQLCNEIKDANPDIKVIIVSAESDAAARELAMLQGADGFLAKPFRVEDLEECLKNI